ncbi:protein of unknown function [Methylotuvimicrobium alcaliphilum 20Z]|uniref:Uncharacterized protein n=1 Tax=Methylotuvimicrobium alcaliphilum (strain DSM 19304 / NCIMB 14124 / VKM B-2133 / 20Z) TaxID=1091494 RepID=G4T357_META2|nr:protein of unknown function [Methylotuvimicrobium alcaliphilum 20Z]
MGFREKIKPGAMSFVAGSVSNSQFEYFADLRVWSMPVEERRKPIHGRLAAAKRPWMA